MKKLFAILALVGFVASSEAATHVSQNMLGPTVYSLMVSNASWGVTNLASVNKIANVNTNLPGGLYTNIAPYYYQVTNLIPGNRIVIVGTNITIAGSITNSTPLGNSVWGPLESGVQPSERNLVNLLGEATVYQNGDLVGLTPGSVTVGVTNWANSVIAISLYNVGNCDAAVTFRFSVLADGETESTTATGDFTCAFTPAATAGVQTKFFPVNAQTFIGAKKIRLVSIDSADTTSADTRVWVTKCTLNTWVP